jgi:hypothetical protein
MEAQYAATTAWLHSVDPNKCNSLEAAQTHLARLKDLELLLHDAIARWEFQTQALAEGSLGRQLNLIESGFIVATTEADRKRVIVQQCQYLWPKLVPILGKNYVNLCHRERFGNMIRTHKAWYRGIDWKTGIIYHHDRDDEVANVFSLKPGAMPFMNSEWWRRVSGCTAPPPVAQEPSADPSAEAEKEKQEKAKKAFEEADSQITRVKLIQDRCSELWPNDRVARGTRWIKLYLDGGYTRRDLRWKSGIDPETGNIYSYGRQLVGNLFDLVGGQPGLDEL